jgi:cyclopropane-fatty-acyl-phospholipid synthase
MDPSGPPLRRRREPVRSWRQSFNRHRGEIARIYDERFGRMSEFYLIGSECSFRHSFNMVLVRGIDTVPLSRDCMFDWKR